MLILNSSNAADDARSFEAAGIGGRKVFDFERDGAKADGTPVKLAFSLAFARDPASPNVRFAVCQHHFPENFWDPAFQTHANGARTVPGAAMVADNPTDHHIFLKAFTGVSDLHSSSIGIKARTENGEVEIMEPVAFRDQFGVSARRQRRGDDAQRDALCGFGYGAGRDIASAERNCLATACRTSGGAAARRPWCNPDIRSGMMG